MLGWLKPRKLPPTSEQLCLSLLVAVEEVAECGVVQQGTGVSVVIAGEVAPISEAVSLLWSKRNEMLLTQLNMCITRVTELSVVIDQSIGLDHSFLRHVCEEELSDLDTCREFTSRVTSRVLKQVTFDVEAECAKFSTEVLRHSSAALANLVSHMLLAPKPPMETALLSMLFMDTRCRTALCNLFDLLCRASLEVCSTPLSSLWSLWDHVNTQQRRPFRQLPRPPRPDPVTQFLVCNSVPLEVMIRSLPHATLGKYSVLLLKSIFLGLVIQRVIGAVVCQRFNWLAEIHTTRLRELSIKARFTPLINVEFTSLSMGSPSIWLAADELISRKQLLVVLRTLMSEIADFVYLRECHELAILALHKTTSWKRSCTESQAIQEGSVSPSP
ncbi:MAG: uncharacterized protein KVP18_000808 [Porospora cf. gigantea A]|uniref:uncharacterized protein n=1 Tax=Porospora cf. gigantea A TaxID=2853593 RepID=UPI003559E409|nr:MAG: hypothetical protein KVP18_000808 [Porospora cf. gigantea A]